ncbi:hypothetical protein PoB_000272000 [Plakobranchus ocellatus]|uniref:Uncharacterized protein n=1 Tax=Plakobranchus ocellatus TaxID=259542 RepID=A0AAV3XZX7_9GAST|nr:hypothetical protein PoB_000272000 [Plakobranchus ocellatus]
MNVDESLRLLNELLSVQDDETEDSNDSDDGIVSVTPILDIATVIKSATECFHRQKCSADDEDEESDNESMDDAIDNTKSDPDYVPSADTSFSQSSFLVAANEEMTAIDSTPTSQNETQTQPSTSTSAPQQEETQQTQPSTCTSAPQQEGTSQIQPSTSTPRQKETLQTKTKFKKRQRNPNQWERNVKKRKVNRGEEYTTKGGNIKPARKTGLRYAFSRLGISWSSPNSIHALNLANTRIRHASRKAQSFQSGDGNTYKNNSSRIGRKRSRKKELSIQQVSSTAR